MVSLAFLLVLFKTFLLKNSKQGDSNKIQNLNVFSSISFYFRCMKLCTLHNVYC